MNKELLYKRYFNSGTRGYKLVKAFYNKYHDLLYKADYPDFNDFLNDIFLSISSINFSKVQQEEHYVIRSVNLQCRHLLDKAIRKKESLYKKRPVEQMNEGEDRSFQVHLKTLVADPLKQLEFRELLGVVHTFKATLTPDKVTIMNALIDGASQKELAKEMNVNPNTLYTDIRRMREKFAKYIRRLGYRNTD